MGTDHHGIEPCECPVPGFCSRYNRRMPGHLHKICQGTMEGVCEHKRAAFIARWSGTETPKPEKPKPQSEVGTRLKEIIRREYGEIACSECAEAVRKLNEMTVEQILADQENLIEGMVERAKKIAPKWWQRLGARLAPGEVRRQCRTMLEEACSVSQGERL